MAAGCGGGGGNLPGGAIAKVGDTTITTEQFNQLMDRAKQSYKNSNQPFPKPNTVDYDRIKSQAVSFLVQQAEFAQEAEKMGITVTEKEIGDRLKQIKRQYFNGDEAAYQKQLKTQRLTEEEVRQDIKNQLVSQELTNEVTADVKVSDADVKKYYESHISTYRQPESRIVRHILISVCGPTTPQGSKCKPDKQAKALANNLFDQLKNGASFATLAKKHSQDPGSASQGGKLTISKGQTVAPFEQTAFLLGVGTVSRPVKTQYGYHLIEPVSEVRPERVTPLKEVKQAISQQLLQQRKQEKMAKWVEDLRERFDVTYADGYKPLSTDTTATTGGTTQPATTSATTTQ